ncbi:MAG: 50S ribosomal protein L10 [Gemmatimonadota bacterium]|nr:MAG: 50S ribosomal protein L10 [Gemmatimonadota bacterium]
MNRTEKSDLVERLSEQFSKSPTIYLTDFTGIAVKPMTELRKKMHTAGVQYTVVKNTLALRAMEAAAVKGVEDVMTGPTAFVFAGEDAIAAAKLLADFQKEHEQLQVKAGLVDGQPVTADEVKRLASLPSREQLLSQALGLMQAPLQGFAGAIDSLLYQMVGAIDALRAQRAAAEPQA